MQISFFNQQPTLDMEKIEKYYYGKKRIHYLKARTYQRWSKTTTLLFTI